MPEATTVSVDKIVDVPDEVVSVVVVLNVLPLPGTVLLGVVGPLEELQAVKRTSVETVKSEKMDCFIVTT